MSKDKDLESVAGIKKDDRNLTVAGLGWEHDTKDPAVELLKEIREDVEHDE